MNGSARSNEDRIACQETRKSNSQNAQTQHTRQPKLCLQIHLQIPKHQNRQDSQGKIGSSITRYFQSVGRPASPVACSPQLVVRRMDVGTYSLGKNPCTTHVSRLHRNDGTPARLTSCTSGLQHTPGTPVGSHSVRTFGHCVKMVMAVTRLMMMVSAAKKAMIIRRGLVVPKRRQRSAMKERRPQAELRIPRRTKC